MKLNVNAIRTTARPLEGATFSKAELRTIAELAAKLSTLDYTTLHTIRQATATEIVRLDDFIPWTDGEAEVERLARQERAMFVHAATQHALTTVRP